MDGSWIECAGAILAGGLGSRMGYVDKSRLRVGGREILSRILAAYRGIFDEVLISARDPAPLTDFLAGQDFGGPGLGVQPRMVPDLAQARGSLAGLHAVLAQARAPHCFVAACDAPFVQPGLIRLLRERLREEDDALVPRRPDGYLEPLCAIYSRRCLPVIEERLAQGRFRVSGLLPLVRSRELPPEDVLAADPGQISFFNVNTPEQFAQAEAMDHDRP